MSIEAMLMMKNATMAQNTPWIALFFITLTSRGSFYLSPCIPLSFKGEGEG
jgi:hypothetical protein